MKNAYKELIQQLLPDEQVEGIVFGDWGDLNDPKFIPKNKRNRVLSLKEAKKYMSNWSFFSDFGFPKTYATYIWTNQRVLWITNYDGKTWLSSASRNPVKCKPKMSGSPSLNAY